MYDVPKAVTKTGAAVAAAYSFGNDVRLKAHVDTRMPGPGVYTLKSGFGRQAYSVHLSGRTAGFGTPSVNGKASRSVLPLEGRASPGPIYLAPSSTTRRQALSTKRSAPGMLFSRADRFRGTAGHTMASVNTPGPGDYVV